jgi:hypothetical protein
MGKQNRAAHAFRRMRLREKVSKPQPPVSRPKRTTRKTTTNREITKK